MVIEKTEQLELIQIILDGIAFYSVGIFVFVFGSHNIPFPFIDSSHPTMSKYLISTFTIIKPHILPHVRATFEFHEENGCLSAHLPVQQCRRHDGDDVSFFRIDVEHVGRWLVGCLLTDVIPQEGIIRGWVICIKGCHPHHCGP